MRDMALAVASMVVPRCWDTRYKLGESMWACNLWVQEKQTLSLVYLFCACEGGGKGGVLLWNFASRWKLACLREGGSWAASLRNCTYNRRQHGSATAPAQCERCPACTSKAVVLISVGKVRFSSVRAYFSRTPNWTISSVQEFSEPQTAGSKGSGSGLGWGRTPNRTWAKVDGAWLHNPKNRT